MRQVSPVQASAQSAAAIPMKQGEGKNVAARSAPNAPNAHKKPNFKCSPEFVEERTRTFTKLLTIQNDLDFRLSSFGLQPRPSYALPLGSKSAKYKSAKYKSSKSKSVEFDNYRRSDMRMKRWTQRTKNLMPINAAVEPDDILSKGIWGSRKSKKLSETNVASRANQLDVRLERLGFIPMLFPSSPTNTTFSEDFSPDLSSPFEPNYGSYTQRAQRLMTIDEERQEGIHDAKSPIINQINEPFTGVRTGEIPSQIPFISPGERTMPIIPSLEIPSHSFPNHQSVGVRAMGSSFHGVPRSVELQIPRRTPHCNSREVPSNSNQNQIPQLQTRGEREETQEFSVWMNNRDLVQKCLDQWAVGKQLEARLSKTGLRPNKKVSSTHRQNTICPLPTWQVVQSGEQTKQIGRENSELEKYTCSADKPFGELSFQEPEFKFSENTGRYQVTQIGEAFHRNGDFDNRSFDVRIL